MFHRASERAERPHKVDQNTSKRKAAKVNDQGTMNQTAVRRYQSSQDEGLTSEITANENETAPYAVQKRNTKTKTTIKEAKTMNNPNTNQDAPSKGQSQQSNQPQARVDIPGNNFQRPGAPAQMNAQGARPSYPGASYPGAAAQPAANASYDASAINTSNNDRRLVISPGISMSGEIDSCDHLVVEGKVEAALKGASVLDIAEQGEFYGTVEINEANIAGRFEGDITVSGRLTIEATGIIIGSVSYKELSMEAGATLDGSVSPIGSQNAGQQPRSSNKSSGKAKKVSQNNGAELPFSDKAMAAE